MKRTFGNCFDPTRRWNWKVDDGDYFMFPDKLSNNMFSRLLNITFPIGLFHRAILMSGSALSGWALSSPPPRDTLQILHKLDCPLEEENEEMLKCLRKRRYQDILAARQSISGYATTFGPVVDNSVVPDHPYKIMSQYNGMFSR